MFYIHIKHISKNRMELHDRMDLQNEDPLSCLIKDSYI